MDPTAAVVTRGGHDGVRMRQAILGPRFARRLSVVHALDNFADALVNVSLVGSLFFSVSLSASQSRILLYLVLTAAPLALVAPFIGSALDRTRLGYRLTIVGSQVIRAIIAVALIGALLTVALYPLVFGLLLCRKSYAIAKTALLSQMAMEPGDLVAAGSHLSITGTIVGGLGTAVGGLLLATLGSASMLGLAAVTYATVAAVSGGLIRPQPSPLSTTAQRLVVGRDDIRAAVWSVAAIRAAAGSLTFLLALAIKRGGGDRWIFVGGLVMAGCGSLIGTMVSGAANRRMAPERVLQVAIAVPAAVCLAGVATIGNLGVLAIALSIGLGNSMASRSMEVIYSRTPSLARGRVIAFSELQLQIAGLIGAGLAVLFAPTPRRGFAVVAVVMLAAGVMFAWSRKISLRLTASQLLFGAVTSEPDAPLPLALLSEAELLAVAGSYRLAVVVADSAVRIALEQDERHLTEADRAEWAAVSAAIHDLVHTDDLPAERFVVDALAAARRVVEHSPHRG